MPHSFYKIWVHGIWSTKNRENLILPKYEKIIHEKIKQQFIESGCPVRIINGIENHVHVLFLLNPKLALSDVMKQVKGSSSHSFNQQNWEIPKFGWQTGFAAYSVSESVFEKVVWYIKNQKEHHKKKTFGSEYNQLIKLHRL